MPPTRPASIQPPTLLRQAHPALSALLDASRARAASFWSSQFDAWLFQALPPFLHQEKKKGKNHPPEAKFTEETPPWLWDSPGIQGDEGAVAEQLGSKVQVPVSQFSPARPPIFPLRFLPASSPLANSTLAGGEAPHWFAQLPSHELHPSRTEAPCLWRRMSLVYAALTHLHTELCMQISNSPRCPRGGRWRKPHLSSPAQSFPTRPAQDSSPCRRVGAQPHSLSPAPAPTHCLWRIRRLSSKATRNGMRLTFSLVFQKQRKGMTSFLPMSVNHM